MRWELSLHVITMVSTMGKVLGREDATLDGLQAAAEFLRNTMDTSINACDDFNGFKCRKIGKLQEDQVGNEQSFSHWDVLTTNFTRKLVWLLDNMQPENTSMPELYKKVNIIYKKCLAKNESTSVSKSIQYAMDFISEIGGCPMLNPDWKSSSRSTLSWALEAQKRFGGEFGLKLVPQQSYISNDISLYLTLSKPDRSARDMAKIIKAFATLAGRELVDEDTIKKQVEDMEALATDFDEIISNAEKSSYWEKISITLEDIFEIDPSSAEALIDYGLTNSSIITMTEGDKNLFGDLKGLWGKFSKHLPALQNFFIGDYLNQITNLLDITEEIEGAQDSAYADSNSLSMTANESRHTHSSETLGKLIADIPETKQNCLSLLVINGYQGGLLENAVLRLVVETYGPNEEESLKLRNLVDLVTEELRKKFFTTPWLSFTSKMQVLNKLSAVVPRIAYPLWIMNNTAFTEHHKHLEDLTSSDSYLKALGIARSNYWLNNILLPDRPLAEDYNDFGMTSFITNAWYEPSRNAFSLSLAFLQPPFYRPDYPPAMIYAIIGAVIGHEIIHGFDTNGVLTSAEGETTEWMSSKSHEKFWGKARCVMDQYSNYCYNTTEMFPEMNGISEYGEAIEEMLCVDGNGTASENIADIDGLKAAYNAYKNFLRDYSHTGVEDDSKKPPGFESNSWDQIFFLAYGSVWCQAYTYSDLRNALWDVHSPTPSRINGTLQSIPEFAEAFHCATGSKMNPRKKCSIY